MPRRPTVDPEQLQVEKLSRRLRKGQLDLMETIYSLGGRCRREFVAGLSHRTDRELMRRLGLIASAGHWHIILTTYGQRVLLTARPQVT